MANMKPNEFAKAIGVSVKTLQRWDNDGTLKAMRNPKDRRYYTDEQLKEYSNNEIAFCKGEATIMQAVRVVNTQRGQSIYIAPEMMVNIMTDASDFEDEYVGQVLEVNEDEIYISWSTEDSDGQETIPWEYILSISVLDAPSYLK